MRDHGNDPLSDVLAEALEKQAMTKREQLARAMWMNTTLAPAEQWERENDITREIYRENVDAILAELREPDERMLEAGNTITQNAGEVWLPSDGVQYDGPSCGLECWQAMIDAIE